MGKVIDIDKNTPHFMALALCLRCFYKWVAVVRANTELFRLTCPRCHFKDSFVSVLPNEFVKETKKP